MTDRRDIDPQETREWLESLDSVLAHDGPERARFLLAELGERASRQGAAPEVELATPYLNTIPPDREPEYPGDLDVEAKLMALLRWNALVMVAKANDDYSGIGGHIGTYQSVATLFETGLLHFWRAGVEGDLVSIQGHAAPGIYARAFLEGRLDEEQLLRFRREVEPGGLSSYPHPWLMPDFWQFATVSMGLSPLTAIYQARFMKYLHHRGLADTEGRKVWAFLGDGEMDEPESLGAIGLAVRESLDNLIFVINCNLQRLDGPVRGNGKIVQELERIFRGVGWNVVKLLWGSAWDPLFAKDVDGKLERRLRETVDGEYQNFAAKGGAYVREKLFSGDPDLEALAADLSDDDLGRLGLARGGHDAVKVHAAYRAAVDHRGGPTVILAQTVKGYGLASAGEGLNIAHNVKSMPDDALLAFRERFKVPVAEGEATAMPFLKPSPESEEIQYLMGSRQALGGPFPSRVADTEPLEVPGLDAFARFLKGTGEREISTTMAFNQQLDVLLRDKAIKERVVPIIADEARTFGMEARFRQLGIYSPQGQLYEPVDSHLKTLYYREDKAGQVLQEGINEAGAVASWTSAGMAYSTHGLFMIPFFIYYSMFGFQRIGDFIWAAADMRSRGFLIGGTAGRTTLNGEGLQHEDGHSHLAAATVPTCVSYDPTFSYELAVIFQDGLRRMYADGEEIFYYVTVMNEKYPQPAMPEGAEEGIRKGMYLLRESQLAEAADGDRATPRVQLLGSGTILREVLAAAEMLEDEWEIAADVWSVTSFTELRRDGLRVDRYNLLHPEEPPGTGFVHRCLHDRRGPVIAATDYMRSFADQIRPFVSRRFVVLGTDGFGRSDTREKLRRFFEVDRAFVTVAALRALAADGEVRSDTVRAAMKLYGIAPDKADPTTV